MHLNSESGDYKLKAEKTVNNVAVDKVSRMVKPGCIVENPCSLLVIHNPKVKIKSDGRDKNGYHLPQQ